MSFPPICLLFYLKGLLLERRKRLVFWNLIKTIPGHVFNVISNRIFKAATKPTYTNAFSFSVQDILS